MLTMESDAKMVIILPYKLCWHSTDTFSVHPESVVESWQHLFI